MPKAPSPCSASTSVRTLPSHRPVAAIIRPIPHVFTRRTTIDLSRYKRMRTRDFGVPGFCIFS